MAEQLNLADVNQQYLNNLVFYKGVPVYVNRVRSAELVSIWNIVEQRIEDVPFNLKDFKAPHLRMGMLNLEGSCVYLSRMPVRRMNIGINMANLIVGLLNVEYPKGKANTKDIARMLQCPSYVEMYQNTYPSLKDAVKMAKESGGACAFDKQFAVDKDRGIHYKTVRVGGLPRISTEVNAIVFHNEYKYLSILLEGNHEKTVAITCSQNQ